MILQLLVNVNKDFMIMVLNIVSNVLKSVQIVLLKIIVCIWKFVLLNVKLAVFLKITVLHVQMEKIDKVSCLVLVI